MQGTPLSALVLFVLVLIIVLPAFAIDREAFTFVKYDLEARIERDQQRLGVRGRLTLRNDSNTPQTIAVLQISSSARLAINSLLRRNNFSLSASPTLRTSTIPGASLKRS